MSETKKTDAAAKAVVPEQASAPDEREVLLKVESLTKHFPIRKGILRRQVGAVKAVDGIDFEVRRGETLGVVGESGCGKSTMGRVITRLQDPTGGQITFEGQDITRLSTGEMRPLRRDIQMIFQDPYGSLNPRHTIGSIVSAPFRLQGVEPEGGVKKEVQRLLELVGLSPEHYNRYPHEFSGGQRQRIGIARALALKPKLVVADEPVSALDVSIQAQVVNLMDDLQEELGLTYVIIAHDLSVVRHVSDRIAVMYLGKIVELADRKALYESPMHPYTKALMSAVPVPDPQRRGQKSERILLRGDVPSPIAPPSGCRFHTRCWKATQICKTTEPPLLELRPGQRVACHHPENFADQAPQDTVLLSAAKEASELVPDTATSAGAEESGAQATAETGAASPSAPDAKATADAKPEADAKAEADNGAKAKADAKPEADSKPEADTKPEADNGAKAKADAEPEATSEPEPETSSESETGSETSDEAGSASESEPEAEAASESEPEAPGGSASGAGPEAGAPAEPEAEAPAEPAAEPAKQAKAKKPRGK
ncbi:dipeptide ABC transporter ATP-binding protein [Streptomyces misionensis]|uniref:Dipeptide ABC transporter ATP-binding protein n=1 Tax=Streptomyces misionensis TaxID=67331 RepID=A0A5C6IM64_9ACTN|nr:dipeptide ABC transporter ATP-binding protein [Streptomyces misionensis]TWV30328.1 dipeptide ABC transporter ATP-binding protein [Streptomyces misionensis]